MIQLGNIASNFTIPMTIDKAEPALASNNELNFIKSTEWAPDGSCILANSNDNIIRIFNYPTEPDASPWIPAVQFTRFPEPIYASAWNPLMSSHHPETCTFIASVRDNPIRMYNAYDGSLSASYVAQDHLEQINAPNSLAFTLDASKIYAGFDSRIQIFDVSRPGRHSSIIATSPTRRSREGQKGIISSISFNPDGSGMYACGSYSGSVGLYDERSNDLIDLLKNMGGVTQCTFSADGLYLYIGSRQCNEIKCWDLRNTGELIYSLNRPGKTNQRLLYSIDFSNRFLATGDTDGYLNVFDLMGENERLVLREEIENDVVSSTSFHPQGGFLVSGSGQRRYSCELYGTVLTMESTQCGIKAWNVSYQSQE